MPRILILANHYNTLRIFRRELIKKIAETDEVFISIPDCDEENKKTLESYGATVIFTPFDRRGMNPLKDIALLREYKRLMREIRPDKVLTYTVKCNVYGALAAKALKIPHCCNITGLGTPFFEGGAKELVVSALYKISANKADRVFFENVGDRDIVVKKNIIKKERTFVLPGAGVNLTEFSPLDYPDEKDGTRFLFIGRIMREKGVDELFSAIKRLKADGEKFTFDFIGWYEENYKETVEKLQRDGLICFHGFRDDVRPFIEKCHCSVLPSWHEGMSNTLLESAACARPLITTDVHGCKEAVEDGISGIIVPVNDADALYNALKRFIGMPYDEKRAAGLAGRAHVEKNFDKEKVVEATLREAHIGKTVIPKIIHYCWFGGNEKPQLVKDCIESWKRFCPDYELKEWNESNFDVNSCTYSREAYENKKWAFVADYARLCALYDEGGVYLDTDMELRQNIDAFLYDNGFAGFESKDFVALGIIGSRPRDSFIGEFKKYYETHAFIKDGVPDTTSNVRLCDRLLSDGGLVKNGKRQTVRGFAIYGQSFFMSNTLGMIFGKMPKNAVSIHHAAQSWRGGAKKNFVGRVRAYLVGKARNLIGTDNLVKLKSGKRV